MTLHDDLANFDTDQPFAGEPERWRIENDSQAAWAMRKLKAARDRQTEIAAIADAERARIQQWQEQASTAPHGDEMFFTGLLEQYVRRQREQENRKSVSTPYGKVQSRETAPRIKVDDPDQATEWLAANGLDSCIKTRLTVALSNVSKEARLAVMDGKVVRIDTGEIVPGLAVTDGGISISIATD